MLQQAFNLSPATDVRLTSGELHGPGTLTANSLQPLGNFNFLDPGAVVNQGTVTISNQIVIGRIFVFENRGTAVFKGSGNVQMPTGGIVLHFQAGSGEEELLYCLNRWEIDGLSGQNWGWGRAEITGQYCVRGVS